MKLQMPAQQQEFDDFNDGAQAVIPDDTICAVVVTDSYCETPEGKSTIECWVSVEIEGGEFSGQKYRYNAKVFDKDKNKSDRAKNHLTTIDGSCGYPMARNQLDLTTNNMNQQWVGKARVRAKFGLIIDASNKSINFIKGFALMPATQQQPVQQFQQPVQQPVQPQQQQFQQQAPQYNQNQNQQQPYQDQPQYQAPQQSYEGYEGF